MAYAPPTPMTPGSHQPVTATANPAVMTPTSMTGTTPHPSGMPVPGTLTPGGPLSAAPGAPPGNLPSFSSIAAAADSPTQAKPEHAMAAQTGYYTPTSGPSISVSAPPSAVPTGRSVMGSAMGSPGLTMAHAQAQAHAQNQAHAQAAQMHQPPVVPSNGVPAYEYTRPGVYDTRTPSPEQPPLDPALSGHSNGDAPPRLNGAQAATESAQYEQSGYSDYPPPLQLQQPYYDGRYEYRREAEWVSRDTPGQAPQMPPGEENTRQGQVPVGSPGSGEYGRRPWE